MKRKVTTFLIIFICFLAQSMLFQHIQMGMIRPNLLLIVVVSFGFIRGKKAGMWVGLVCGLLADLFWGNILGFYALIFVILGYINGSFQKLFYNEDPKLPLLLVGMSDLLYGAIVYFCLFLLQGEFYFSYYFFHIVLPELVYTVLLALVLYRVILFVNRKLEEEEQRSASRFV